jgi:DNA-binding IclR family transcriptional regulator
MPQLRWRLLDALALSGQQTTNTLARAALHPSRSVRRALEDLTAHRVVERIPAGRGEPDHWRLAADRRIAAVWLAEGTVPEIADPPLQEGTATA